MSDWVLSLAESHVSCTFRKQVTSKLQTAIFKKFRSRSMPGTQGPSNCALSLRTCNGSAMKNQHNNLNLDLFKKKLTAPVWPYQNIVTFTPLKNASSMTLPRSSYRTCCVVNIDAPPGDVEKSSVEYLYRSLFAQDVQSTAKSCKFEQAYWDAE